MKGIFLGPLLHWLILVALVALGWLAGLDRLHVSDFNPFLLALLGVTVAVIVLVLKTSPPGTRVTRDAIEDED